MKRHSYALELRADNIFTIEAFIAKAHTAARAGDLDWGAAEIIVKLEFLSHDPEGFAALEAFRQSQDRIDGLPITVERSEALVRPPRLP
jgi:hypothetical protein